MRLALALLLAVCAAFIPGAGHAQFRDQLYTTPVIPSSPAASANASSQPTVLLVIPASAMEAAGPNGASDPALILGGVVGGSVGLVSGMFLGAVIDGEADPDCIDFCFGPGLVLGLLAGEALGMSAGVHIANGRRGSLPLGMLTSAGILTFGLVAGNSFPPSLIIVPLSQLAGSIWVERRTNRRR